MKGTKSSLEVMLLERYRISLKNAEEQSDIAQVMAEYGYTAKEFSEGKALLLDTRTAFDSKLQEAEEESSAYQAFNVLRGRLSKQYSVLRKKAKVVYRKDALMCDKLAVSGDMPNAYINWFEVIRKFINVAMASEEVRTKLARLKVSEEDLNLLSDDLNELKNLRAIYLKEKGESQNATQIKDESFAKLDDWMREFYAVAKIALEDQPQLLESLGIVVK
ncbi:hypothetical protein [Carboxylicivirga sp. N1Y90]|uniref:hypothetical protein n=1 Tax=Carboxylicivirga fragile TaxID=3417571 RepID=UPI003D32EB8F|nr:hypothetical protein [Marinilabiliaceae bacterium N1Y90]